ncbi:hypothetical protein ALP54_101884 [Pseudomonas amygdali pv. lachrymans]|nr:hypothetical protein ALP54_101884 [Pseudomonas amygdali pv. lachrymans]
MSANLKTQPVTQAVIPGTQRSKRGAQHLPARERIVGQVGERIKALCLTAQRLGQYLARQMRISHAVSAATLRVIDVVAKPANLRQARQGQQKVAGPCVVDLHILELWKRLEHLRPDNGFDVGGISGTVDHAAAEDQALVGAEAVVIQQVIAILDAVILRQKCFGQFIAQRLCGDHLSATRHRLGSQLRNQIAQIGVAGHDDEFRADLALRRMDHRAGTALDANGRRLLVNRAAQGLDRGRFTQRQIERVNMAAGHVQQPADILITGNDFVDPALVHQLKAGVAVTLPQSLLGFQMRQLLAGQCCKYTAILQVALDTVAGNPITDDGCALKGHLPQQLRLAWPDGSLDHINVTAVTIDDLPAITPRRAKADFCRFQHRDPESILQQEQRTRQACIASSDDAHVGFDFTLQRWTFRGGIG